MQNKLSPFYQIEKKLHCRTIVSRWENLGANPHWSAFSMNIPKIHGETLAYPDDSYEFCHEIRISTEIAFNNSSPLLH